MENLANEGKEIYPVNSEPFPDAAWDLNGDIPPMPYRIDNPGAIPGYVPEEDQTLEDDDDEYEDAPTGYQDAR